MSISDQAFIRAYHEESTVVGSSEGGSAIEVGLGSVIPPPHAKFPPMPTAAPKHVPGIEEISAEEQLEAPVELKTEPMQSVSPKQIERRLHPALDQSPKTTLSALTSLRTPVMPVVAQPKPALEIDAVQWPAVCQTLVAKHAERFDKLALELCRASAIGQKVTAISGLRRGEGRTTLALCLAQRLAASRAKVVLVDADFCNPSLATQLQIVLDGGWETALSLTGGDQLWEHVIESITDRVGLALLGSEVANEPTPAGFRISSVLSQLAENYDVVLVDAGPISVESSVDQWLLEREIHVDNVILTHDVRHTPAYQLAAGCVQLIEAKRRQLGIAETFTAES